MFIIIGHLYTSQDSSDYIQPRLVYSKYPKSTIIFAFP